MIVALKVLAVLTFIGYKQTNQQTPNCKYIYRLNDFRYPKVFFQVATSKGYVPKSQLPKGMFPSHNFPKVQFPKRQLPKSARATALGPQSVLAATLGPLAHPSPIAASGASEGLT